jgi:hypothetical protein
MVRYRAIAEGRPPLGLQQVDAMLEQSDSVVYRIDADDTIDFVNDTWTQFATANDAATLACDIVGSSIWDHIDGVSVIQVYRHLLWRVRTNRVSATFPFRCDSPDRFRHMQLVIQPLEKDRVEFVATLQSEGLHAKPIELLRAQRARDSAHFLRICSWCKAFCTTDGWVPIEKAIEQTSCYTVEPFPMLTHGICDACLNTFDPRNA